MRITTKFFNHELVVELDGEFLDEKKFEDAVERVIRQEISALLNRIFLLASKELIKSNK